MGTSPIRMCLRGRLQALRQLPSEHVSFHLLPPRCAGEVTETIDGDDHGLL